MTPLVVGVLLFAAISFAGVLLFMRVLRRPPQTPGGGAMFGGIYAGVVAVVVALFNDLPLLPLALAGVAGGAAGGVTGARRR